MTSSAHLPMERAGAVERLLRARRTVRAAVESPSGAEPRVVTSPSAIRAVPADVEAIVAARTDAGLAPGGADFPRDRVLRRVAVPSAVLAVLALVLLMIGFLLGSMPIVMIALVLLIGFVASTVLAGRYATADPLRLSPQARTAITEAARWTPSRDWSGGRAATPDGALVAVAADAARRIVATPAWRSGVLTRCGVDLALAPELDRIETQSARVTTDDDEWTRLIARASALTAYAETLEQLGADEPEQQDVEVLAFLLSASIHDVP